MNINIALAQMALTLGEPEKNYQKVGGWVGKAADQGADLILLPELWASGYDLKKRTISQSADHSSNKTITRFIIRLFSMIKVGK